MSVGVCVHVSVYTVQECIHVCICMYICISVCMCVSIYTCQVACTKCEHGSPVTL